MTEPVPEPQQAPPPEPAPAAGALALQRLRGRDTSAMLLLLGCAVLMAIEPPVLRMIGEARDPGQPGEAANDDVVGPDCDAEFLCGGDRAEPPIVASNRRDG